MRNFLRGYEPYFYAIMRIVVGFMFALHGAQKLFGFPPQTPNPCQCPAKPPMPDFMATLLSAGGIIELVGGIMIMLGLFAGFAAFIASGMMAVAYFMAHQPGGILPIQNGGEPAVIYCFIFLFIAARGSGVLSLDSMIFGKDIDTHYRT